MNHRNANNYKYNMYVFLKKINIPVIKKVVEKITKIVIFLITSDEVDSTNRPRFHDLGVFSNS